MMTCHSSFQSSRTHQASMCFPPLSSFASTSFAAAAALQRAHLASGYTRGDREARVSRRGNNQCALTGKLETTKCNASGRVCTIMAAVRSCLGCSKGYPMYVLFVLMLVYFLNQLDRFVLGIAARSISRDLNFGRLGCFYNLTALSEPRYANSSCEEACLDIKNESS